MKYKDFFIETNGECFRAYQTIGVWKGFWKWKHKVERKSYIWSEGNQVYGPRAFDTIEAAKYGIDREIMPPPCWELVKCNP